MLNNKNNKNTYLGLYKKKKEHEKKKTIVNSNEKITNKKVIVFDLDETIGYFTQLGIFYSIIESFKKDNVHYEFNKHIELLSFNKLIDIYPEFLRPNILNILNTIKSHYN